MTVDSQIHVQMIIQTFQFHSISIVRQRNAKNRLNLVAYQHSNRRFLRSFLSVTEFAGFNVFLRDEICWQMNISKTSSTWMVYFSPGSWSTNFATWKI